MTSFQHALTFFTELNALDMDAMISDIQAWKDAQCNTTPPGSTSHDLYSNVLIVEGFRMYALRYSNDPQHRNSS